ncbi:hypothetical protein HJFPF1_00039 [Paramyrothecium foliicola]|nr:hypothetical protein HJFPF1_00039 [Paramyrothecium foliicola]
MVEMSFSQAPSPPQKAFLEPLTYPSHEPTPRDAKELVLDSLACCIGFLAFAILAKIHENARISSDLDFYNGLMQLANYGPTLFPILFAAVGARTIKAFIQWRLQRGERLGTLDLLASSTTVGGAITAQVALRSVSILGFALIVVWALSPIGGQASLRILAKGPEATTVPLRYLLPSTSIFSWTGGTHAKRRKPLVNSMWFSLLLGSQESRTATVDIWNNVKIPMIEPLEDDQTADDGGWYRVLGNTTEYASLAGVPLSPQPNTSVMLTFPLETWYWTLDCYNLTSDRTWIAQQFPVPNTNESQTTESTWKDGFCDTISGTGCLLSNLGSGDGVREPTDAKMPPRQLFFSAEDYSFEGDSTNLKVDGLDSVSAGVCHMSTVYVEAQIDCVGRDCAASKVRRSLSPLAVPAWTPFDYTVGNGALQFFIFAQMFTTSLTSSASNPTAVSAYLANPLSPFSLKQYPPASTLPHQTYSRRVAQLLNTYWGALGGTSVLAAGLGDRNGSLSESFSFWDVPFNTSSTSGVATVPNAIITCHNGWFIMAVFASTTLLMICLVGPLLRFRTANPELALNFSSLLRDNAYVSGSGSQTYLEAPDRARFMRNVKIQYGDVKPEEAVGHLALASVDSTIIFCVRKGREYD